MWRGLFHQNKIVSIDAIFYLHLVQMCVEVVCVALQRIRSLNVNSNENGTCFGVASWPNPSAAPHP